jgi:hypothetical protein
MSRLLYTDAIHCVLAWLPLHDALPAMHACRAWYTAGQTEPSRNLAIRRYSASKHTACAIRSTLGRGRHVRETSLLYGNSTDVDDASWRTMCASDALRTLHMTARSRAFEALQTLPRSLTSLTILSYDDVDAWSDALWAACARLAHLHHFEYAGPSPAWSRVWQTMPRLETLTVEGWATNFGASVLPASLRTLTVQRFERGAARLPNHVTRVTLTHATRYCLDALPRELQHLALCAPSNGATPLVDFARRFPRLQTLEAPGSEWVDAITSVSNAVPLPTLTRLTSLALYGVGYARVDLATVLRMTPRAHTLKLSGHLFNWETRRTCDETEHACSVIRLAAASRIARLHLTYRVDEQWCATERHARLHASPVVAKALDDHPAWCIEVEEI